MESAKSQDIIYWLSSCDRSPNTKPFPRFSTAPYNGKRNKRDMDDGPQDTPRPKRQARGPATPSASNSGHRASSAAGDSNTTHSSSKTRSRQSSPKKRQREAVIEFSKPAHEFYSRNVSRRWKETLVERRFPLLQELLASLQAARSDVTRQALKGKIDSEVAARLDDVLKRAASCEEKEAPKDTWCERVVFPTLKLAEDLSQSCVEAINVKTIDVFPQRLLPTNAQTDYTVKKRVDYVLGTEVAGTEEVRALLQEMDEYSYTITQSNHKLLRDQALCSLIEVKTRSNNENPRHQLYIWCAAGFEKQQDLWRWRQRQEGRRGLQLQPQPMLAPLPLWIWEEDKIQLFIAVMDLEESRIHILHETDFEILVDDKDSLLNVLAAFMAVMRWGGTHYLPWLRRYLSLEIG